MALKMSTGLKNNQMGKAIALDATGITLTITTTHTISITAGTDNLLTKGFRPDDVGLLSGMPTGGNNDHVTITSIATDGQSCVVSETLTNEAGGGDDCLTLVNGKGFNDTMNYGALDIFPTSQPANADTTEGATRLVRITLSSGAVTAGTKTNGLTWGDAASSAISKSGTWSGVVTAAGTAAWGRYYDNALVTGASTTARRFDGLAGTSGKTFVLSTVEMVVGQTVTCDSATLTQRSSKTVA